MVGLELINKMSSKCPKPPSFWLFNYFPELVKSYFNFKLNSFLHHAWTQSLDFAPLNPKGRIHSCHSSNVKHSSNKNIRHSILFMCLFFCYLSACHYLSDNYGFGPKSRKKRKRWKKSVYLLESATSVELFYNVQVVNKLSNTKIKNFYKL